MQLILTVGVTLCALVVPVIASAQREGPSTRSAAVLENMTWAEAERVMTPEAVVVLPLGAAAKEHGLHMPLNTDYLIARYFAQEVGSRSTASTVIAPILPYGYYPAFLEYHGSTTVQAATARDMIVEMVRAWAGQGPKRFYVINIGISTSGPLAEAAKTLALEGILLDYTDYAEVVRRLPTSLLQQAGGSHADEIETSIMLHIDPSVVKMSLAQEDYRPRRPPALTRDPNGPGTYSPTGAWGNPTLASARKGAVIVAAFLETMLNEIDLLRSGPLPTPSR